MMSLQEASIEEERWSRIATRSRRFMDAPEGVPFMVLEERRGRMQIENHAPQLMTLPLFAFREEVERGSIDGLEWKLPRSSDGTLSTFNIDEFVRMKISFRPADVLGLWPEWPAVSASNAAKTRPWQPLSGIPKGWIRSLPASAYLPFADVVDFLAFGPAKTAIGLRGGHCTRQCRDRRQGRVRWHAMRTIGDLASFAPNRPSEDDRAGNSASELVPVPFGGRGWLGPRRYADEYAELGHAPQSVSFCEIFVERASLLKWMNAGRGKRTG